MRLYDGNASDVNLLAELYGYQNPENVSSCDNEMHVVFSSSYWGWGSRGGYLAEIHVTENDKEPGEIGFCTSRCPCGNNEGHCESNDQCISGHNCGYDNCKPELGYENGINCCYNIAEFCSRFLTNENNTWTLQTPANDVDEYVTDVTCLWHIDVTTNSNEGNNGSTTCGVAQASWACCTNSGPCASGDGDCDNDGECENGLTCGTDNCGPNFPYGYDCCIEVISEVVPHLALQTFEVSVP